MAGVFTVITRQRLSASRARRRWVGRLTHVGLAIVLLSLIHLAALLLVGFRTGRVSPYIGSYSYIAVVPGLLFGGLLLTVIGLAQSGRLRTVAAVSMLRRPRAWPRIDLNLPAHRRAFLVVAGLGIIAASSTGAATYHGYEFMESTRFCSGVCHQQMRPEAVAHEESAHAAVACSTCHVGPGVGNFVRSKMAGLQEMVSLVQDAYTRPIPSPIDKMLPAREVCGQCHSSLKQYGNQVVLRPHFASDEQNSDRSVAVLVKTGGPDRNGKSTGSHWHADPKNRVRYVVSEGDPEAILWIGLSVSGGKTAEYFSTERPISAAVLARAEKRTMDCLDCHNRQGHSFVNADQAVDNAIAAGAIDRDLPYVRKVTLDAVSRPYASAAQARQSIAESISGFYRANYPSLLAGTLPEIRHSIEAAEVIWARNVFPEMKVTWGSYPDNIGHRDSPGCFRCHDQRHVSREGKAIGDECADCHVPPVPKPTTAGELAAGGAAMARETATGASARPGTTIKWGQGAPGLVP